MPETNNNFEQKPVQSARFTSKPVEQPMFSDQTRVQLGGSEVVASNGLKSFYQANKWYVLAIVVGVLLIGSLSYLAFRKKPAQQVVQANVVVTVEIPKEVSSGNENTYRIVIDNKDSQKLTDMQLELVYPDGVTYIDSRPVKAGNLSGSLFSVPDLLSGQNAVIFVTTRITGNVGDTKVLLAKLHYRYNNFSSDFIADGRAEVRLLPSGVMVDISGPAQTNNAQLVSYKVHYKNTSDEDIKNARVVVNFGDGFTFGSSTPAPDLGINTWNVSSLPKDADGSIEIQGTYSAINPGESKTITAEFLILGDNGSYFSQSMTNFATAIASQPLVVMQSVDLLGEDGVVKPGDTISYSIKYQNNAAVAAAGVNISVTLDSKALDLSTIQAEGGQVSGGVISWNASLVSSLESLLPGEGGELRFSVGVKNPATKDSSKNLSVVSHVKIKSNEYETAFPGNDIAVKIASPASVNPSVQFVSGENPPRAGKVTTYKVVLDLKNSSNDFSNSFVTAFVPVSFDMGSVSQVEQKNVTFDSSTGKITWNVGALPAYTGKTAPSRKLEFQVKISPSQSQLYTNVLLVRNLSLDATDTYTTKAIKITAGDITTQDVGDGSMGQVQP